MKRIVILLASNALSVLVGFLIATTTSNSSMSFCGTEREIQERDAQLAKDFQRKVIKSIDDQERFKFSTEYARQQRDLHDSASTANLVAAISNTGGVQLFRASDRVLHKTLNIQGASSPAVSAMVTGRNVVVTHANGRVTLYDAVNGSYKGLVPSSGLR